PSRKSSALPYSPMARMGAPSACRYFGRNFFQRFSPRERSNIAVDTARMLRSMRLAVGSWRLADTFCQLPTAICELLSLNRQLRRRRLDQDPRGIRRRPPPLDGQLGVDLRGEDRRVAEDLLRFAGVGAGGGG